jgi:predicted aldo/keto reductase-like oxidoreductase
MTSIPNNEVRENIEKIRLGRTGLMVSRSGFGAIPIQRISESQAIRLLHKAYDHGCNFYDTARAYTDSEAKLGAAFADRRDRVIIASKSMATDSRTYRDELGISLKNLRTDYLDIHQFHNPRDYDALFAPGGLYEAALEAQAEGKIRLIGITSHRLDIALKAAVSGKFATVQFPLSLLSTDEELKLIDICRAHDVGVIAMKGLAGGLITKSAAAFAFLRQFVNLVPIWGLEAEWQLDEFLAYEADPPLLDDAMWETINADRLRLGRDFCRGCGYCLPCPVGIPIPTAARIIYLMGRSTYRQFLAADWREQMNRINDCLSCGHCQAHCPYELDTPALLRKMLAQYHEFCELHREEVN